MVGSEARPTCPVARTPTRALPASLTLAHVLRDNVDGLFGHHGVQLHEFFMPQFLHNLGLLQEGLRRHRTRLQGFDGHPGGAVPGTCVDRCAGCLRGGPPFPSHRDAGSACLGTNVSSDLPGQVRTQPRPSLFRSLSVTICKWAGCSSQGTLKKQKLFLGRL